MNRLLRLLALPLLVFALAGCANYSWHQKLTLLIETPSGEITGTSVVEAGWQGPIKRLAPELDTGNSSLTGEAMAVEVRPGRWLFVLLRGQESLLYALLNNGGGMEETAPAILAQRDPLPVRPDLYPLMVTFDDIHDPKTVRRVDPADLAATFGPGVSLKGLTIAVTDEPVTKGKAQGVLGWLGKTKGRIKPTDKKYADELTVEETLYRGDFKVGE